MKKFYKLTGLLLGLFALVLLVPVTGFAAENESADTETYNYEGDVLDQAQKTSSVILAVGTTEEIKFDEVFPSAEIASVTWTSSNESVAAIGADGELGKGGVVTAKKAGTAAISVNGTLADGRSFSDEIAVTVTNPKFSAASLTINIAQSYKSGAYYYYDNNTVSLKGLNGNSSVGSVKSSSTNLKVEHWYDEFSFYPKKTGTYTVSAVVDGKKLSLKVYVRNIYFARNRKTLADGSSTTWVEGESMVAMYRGETAALTLKGVPSGKKATFKSSKTSVATVNSAGNVTAKGIGYATVTATVDGIKLTYEVGVSYKKAILAMRYANNHFGSTYSQPKRMQKGYYDCSSFVWFSYKYAKFYLGSKSWAPTAAGEASWCAKNGYIVYSGTVDVAKLLPGDLIFWCGANNGRYKGIYHVDIFQGNYAAMTVERQKFFGSTISNVMIARPCGTKGSAPKIAKSGSAFEISWGKTYGATGYQVYRATSKNGKYTRVATVKTNNYTDKRIASGKTYYYKIRPYWTSRGKTYKGKYSSIVGKKK